MQNEIIGSYRDSLRKHLESNQHYSKILKEEEAAHWNCIELLGGVVQERSKLETIPILEDFPLSDEKETELYFTLADFLIQRHLPFIQYCS